MSPRHETTHRPTYAQHMRAAAGPDAVIRPFSQNERDAIRQAEARLIARGLIAGPMLRRSRPQ